jgi:Uma2 family endonuclease
MKAVVKLSRRATYADYLTAEQSSMLKHEFLDGIIVAMAGGSLEHNAIGSRMAFVVQARIDLPCRYFSTDQRFWIAANRRGRYADGSIVCGAPERPPHDDQAVTNPSVVVEVLSPSTEGDDEGDKRRDFQSLWSLRAYVLIHQDQRCVRVHRRSERGEWSVEPEIYRAGDQLELPVLTRPIPVAEIYDGILDAGGHTLLR